MSAPAANAHKNAKTQGSKTAKSTNDGQQRSKDLNSMLINGSLTQSSYQRLTSLAPPRDLTLGGNKTAAAPKKVFTPNLNVVRNKNINVKTSKDMTAVRGRGRGRGATHSERGRGGISHIPAGLIQTTGVFSEGAGKLLRKTSNSGRSLNDECKQLRKPILPKNELKVQKSEKYTADLDGKLRDVLGENTENFFDEKTDINMRPVKLQQSTWNLVSNMIKTEIKVEKTDENTSSNDVSAADMAKQFEDMHVQLHEKRRQQALVEMEREQEKFFRPQSIEEFLKSSTSQLFLMQLPEELPCDLDDIEPEWEAKRTKNMKTENTDIPKTTAETGETENTSTTSRDTPSPTSNEKLFNKNPPPCGRVGKLVRYKSGKVKLVLGTAQFDLDMGLDTGIPQDLMLIDVDDESLTGNITKLGPLRAKFTAEPDWDYLLQQQRSTRNNKK